MRKASSKGDSYYSSQWLGQEGNKLLPELPPCPEPFPLILQLVGKPKAVAGFADSPAYLVHSPFPPHPIPPLPLLSTCHSEITGQGKFQASTQGKPIHSRNGGRREGCCGDEEGLGLRGPGRTRAGTCGWGGASWDKGPQWFQVWGPRLVPNPGYLRSWFFHRGKLWGHLGTHSGGTGWMIPVQAHSPRPPQEDISALLPQSAC